MYEEVLMAEPESPSLIAGLPHWISVPILIVSTALGLLSKIRSAIIEANKERRLLEEQKLRLEILKLRYEIEALKVAHGPVALPEFPVIKSAQIVGPTEHTKKYKFNEIPSSAIGRGGWGALGGAINAVAVVIYNDEISMDILVFPSHLVVIVIQVLIVVVGGACASIVLKRYRLSIWKSIVVGFVAVTVVQLLLYWLIYFISVAVDKWQHRWWGPR
jgi:hypothetical protein